MNGFHGAKMWSIQGLYGDSVETQVEHNTKDEVEAGAAAGEQGKYQSHGSVFPEVSCRRISIFLQTLGCNVGTMYSLWAARVG